MTSKQQTPVPLPSYKSTPPRSITGGRRKVSLIPSNMHNQIIKPLPIHHLHRPRRILPPHKTHISIPFPLPSLIISREKSPCNSPESHESGVKFIFGELLRNTRYTKTSRF